MRIRHQLATTSLAFFMTFGMSTWAKSAAPTKVETLVAQVKIFTSDEETEKTANEILKLDPSSGDAHSMLEWNRFREHKIDSSIELGKKAIGLKFKDQFWMRRAHNCLYHCYIERKEWEDALKYCLLCYKVERNSGIAHDLAILYAKTGNAKLSKEYAETAEKISSEQHRAIHEIVSNIKQADDPKTVDTILDRVNEGLAKNPKDFEAILLRAQCYRTKKLYTKALKDYDTAIAMRPESGVLYFDRAQIYTLMGDDKKSAASILEGKKHGFDLEKFRADIKQMRESVSAERTAGSGTPTSKSAKVRPD